MTLLARLEDYAKQLDRAVDRSLANGITQEGRDAAAEMRDLFLDAAKYIRINEQGSPLPPSDWGHPQTGTKQ
jgi:hypothetical protein